MRLAVLATIACLSAAPALAQQTQLDRVYACASLKEDAARLACFDAAVAGLRGAQVAGDVAVVSRAQIEAAQKDAFGLDVAALDNLARAAAASTAAPGDSAAPAVAPPLSLDLVQVAVQSVERRPNGTYRFMLDNGQVWDQIDTYDLGRTLKGPLKAEIRKAAFGSYMLKAERRAAVRVRRIR